MASGMIGPWYLVYTTNPGLLTPSVASSIRYLHPHRSSTPGWESELELWYSECQARPIETSRSNHDIRQAALVATASCRGDRDSSSGWPTRPSSSRTTTSLCGQFAAESIVVYRGSLPNKSLASGFRCPFPWWWMKNFCPAARVINGRPQAVRQFPKTASNLRVQPISSAWF